MGIEPTNAGTTIRCVNPFATLTISIFSFFSLTNQGQRLYIGRLVEGVGFEPTKHSATDLQSAPFGHFGTPPKGSETRVIATRIQYITTHETGKSSFSR